MKIDTQQNDTCLNDSQQNDTLQNNTCLHDSQQNDTEK